jgi:hypothetical protein
MARFGGFLKGFVVNFRKEALRFANHAEHSPAARATRPRRRAGLPKQFVA